MTGTGGQEGVRGRMASRWAVPYLAALDLGTNNCRLLIAQAGPDGRLRVVDSFSRIIRLGEGLARDGVLSEAAIERALAALKICAAHLKHHDNPRLRAVATEACRRARNGRELVERARAETGIGLEIVSEEEEARLAALGAAPLVGHRYRGALVFDIGGGSTEIIWLKRKDGAVANMFSASVPLGVVTLAEQGSGYDDLRGEIRPHFAQLKRRMERAGEFALRRNHLLGISGTVTTLGGIALGLPRYDRSKVDGSWHKVARLAALADEIARLDATARAAVPCIGEERAELMLPGLAIFASICEEWPCAELRVADRGLREGILLEMTGAV
jgi:exopolyphosphatase / guanosine-5'-triphosphate,3'-diphosphate pyrophosphatase